ncbi:sugar-transfer associated ATP-grasp domain-containing protein [Halonatronum saccharophilum]|uniref:sugar-transfer associated ATP-grasp domain-containing protein n=1 Tax=Halonatronum saccharophilum TaxID=150060 RepID=UPI0004841ACA|nr:sugar-transfer associated ATP-grasp domain-containing protein [Halonatronum saccharophilum]
MDLFGDFSKLKVFLKDKDKKSYPRMAYEITKIILNTKSLPRHYFSACLYKNYISNYLDYISVNQYDKIKRKLQNRNFKELLDNKLFFQYYFQDKINVPKILAYNMESILFTNSETYSLNSNDQLKDLIKLLIEQSTNRAIFLKDFSNNGGKNCFKITLSNLNGYFDDNNFFNLITSSSFIIQDCINQHSQINKIYSKSINSIRAETFINDKGEIEIISALMRFGVGGSYVDNCSQGGIFTSVNLEKGTLGKYAYDFFKAGNSDYINRHTIHPDTQFKFEGTEIPYFLELKQMIRDTAILLPQIRLVGWDFAITENGPILIEGNLHPGNSKAQMACNGYKTNKVFKKIIENYG